jgi:hypothetical protein
MMEGRSRIYQAARTIRDYLIENDAISEDGRLTRQEVFVATGLDEELFDTAYEDLHKKGQVIASICDQAIWITQEGMIAHFKEQTRGLLGRYTTALENFTIQLPLASTEENRGAANSYQTIIHAHGKVFVGGMQHMPQERVVNIGAGATINAPVVIADTIENAFNTVTQSGLENQLKETLQQLIKAVTEISKSIPQDKAQSMANDVETLSKELTTAKRPSTIQRILGDIRDTATTLGQIATPVLGLIEKLSLLLPGAS